MELWGDSIKKVAFNVYILDKNIHLLHAHLDILHTVIDILNKYGMPD